MQVAIIGHGRSPEGKGWAGKIDACDYVVRMWDCHWQNDADYGDKYDYGVVESPPSILRTFRRYNQCQPEKGYIVSLLGRDVSRNILHSDQHKTLLPEPVELVDQTRWNDIGMRLGGLGATGRLQFTRGTVAACWMIEHLKRDDKLILVGFDNVHKGVALPVEEGFPEAYRHEPSTFTFAGYKPGRKYGNHDFGIEYPVMLHLANKHGVKLLFAQDCWADDVSVDPGGRSLSLG